MVSQCVPCQMRILVKPIEVQEGKFSVVFASPESLVDNEEWRAIGMFTEHVLQMLFKLLGKDLTFFTGVSNMCFVLTQVTHDHNKKTGFTTYFTYST